MSLALWEFFWTGTDWTGVVGATTVTLSAGGALSGFVNQPSGNFVVGANGTISGTLVVTVAGVGGTVSQATFSLSAGTTTGTFTFTPTSLGVHAISATNNQGLINPANLSYLAIDLPVSSLKGGKRDQGDTGTLPDEYWEERARRMTQDAIRKAEAFTHISVLEPNHAVQAQLEDLAAERVILLQHLPQASDIPTMQALAHRLKAVDAEIATLTPQRHSLVKKKIT